MIAGKQVQVAQVEQRADVVRRELGASKKSGAAREQGLGGGIVAELEVQVADQALGKCLYIRLEVGVDEPAAPAVEQVKDIQRVAHRADGVGLAKEGLHERHRRSRP